MLAYPTPTFDAKTILQAPGYRPAGRGSCLEYEKQPEAVTPLNLVNRHTTNGGFVGTRAKKFIQNNQFKPDHYDPTKGTPLSKPGSVGNVVDQAISVPPKYAEPANGELKAILDILNGKPVVPEHVGKLSAKQIESLKAKRTFKSEDDAKKVVDDFSDARDALRKENMIKKAISQGFTPEEAKKAYEKMRLAEAETALFRDEDPSTRLYDLIDSKISGTQNGSIRGNDETGLFLAKGDNAIMVKKAQDRNSIMDSLTEPDLLSFPKKTKKLEEHSVSDLFSMISLPEKEEEKKKRGGGRKSDEAIAIITGKSVEEIKAERKAKKEKNTLITSFPGFAGVGVVKKGKKYPVKK